MLLKSKKGGRGNLNLIINNYWTEKIKDAISIKVTTFDLDYPSKLWANEKMSIYRFQPIGCCIKCLTKLVTASLFWMRTHLLLIISIGKLSIGKEWSVIRKTLHLGLILFVGSSYWGDNWSSWRNGSCIVGPTQSFGDSPDQIFARSARQLDGQSTHCFVIRRSWNARFSRILNSLFISSILFEQQIS